MEVEIPVGFRFYRELIAAVAGKHQLEPAIVAAICWQESSFNTDAFRFERDFYNRYLKTKPEYASKNPRVVSSSYGLMQIMLPVAHERGFPKEHSPELLFVPEIGLEWGCQHLRYLVDWAQQLGVDVEKTEQATLASYNGGRGGNDPTKTWPLRNGKYAREVSHKTSIMRGYYVSR